MPPKRKVVKAEDEPVAPPPASPEHDDEEKRIEAQLLMENWSVRLAASVRDLAANGGMKDLGHIKQMCQGVKMDCMAILRATTPRKKTALQSRMERNPGELFLSVDELAELKAKNNKQARDEYAKMKKEHEQRYADLQADTDKSKHHSGEQLDVQTQRRITAEDKLQVANNEGKKTRDTLQGELSLIF